MEARKLRQVLDMDAISLEERHLSIVDQQSWGNWLKKPAIGHVGLSIAVVAVMDAVSVLERVCGFIYLV